MLSTNWILRAFLATSVAIIFCVAGVSILFLYQSVRTPIAASDQFLVIESGAGLSKIARQFEQQGYTRSEWPVIFWGVLSGVSASLKAGEYFIETGETPAQVLGKIGRGEIFERKVTILEGVTFREMSARLAQAKKLKDQLSQMSDTEVMNMLNLDAPSIEGSFFPDTYHYVLNESNVDVLSRAAAKMKRVLNNIWKSRSPNLSISSKYEALILASIIQKEAMLEAEMPVISGVLQNRLKIGMRLQTDPTVIFGLGPDFEGRLKRSHLKMDTAYNTYTRHGLPPGPIAAPGRAALSAAVNPSETEFLYFVAKGDGSHYFSKTLAEHNQAVKRFIK